jgi:hypothetical protein
MISMPCTSNIGIVERRGPFCEHPLSMPRQRRVDFRTDSKKAGAGGDSPVESHSGPRGCRRPLMGHQHLARYSKTNGALLAAPARIRGRKSGH